MISVVSPLPDSSKITRFKQDFLDDLQPRFDRLVDLTEPICQVVDSAKADMTIFDSSGIEAFVAENNPKYANRIIRQLKAYAKANHFDKNYDPYKAAYSIPCLRMPLQIQRLNSYTSTVISVMSSNLASSPMVLGIIRHIAFITKLLCLPILILPLKRNLIRRMKTSLFMIPDF